MKPQKTKVLFLKNSAFSKDEPHIYAFFPDLIESSDMRLSYSHIGQHSSCSIEYAEESQRASQSEAEELRQELEQKGYNLELVGSEKKERSLDTIGAALFLGFLLLCIAIRQLTLIA